MKAIQPSRAFHLRNWSIGAKLAASFGLIILVTIGLATTGLFSLLLVQRTLDKVLNEGLQIEALGNRVQDRLSGARRLEQAFLLHWQDEGYQNAAGMYLMPRGSYIRDIRQAVVRLDNLTASGQTEFSIDIKAESRQLLAALETYHTEFNLVTNLLMDRGTNQSGAIGDLETVSLELAAELETLGQPELITVFLRLRLNEKQYRLLSEQQYSERVSLALQELRATLARVAPAESERLVPLLDRYEQAFDEVNRLDAEIASHIDRYTAAAEAIQSLAFDIAADGAQLADEELDSVAESVQRARIALVLAIMVAAALSIVLSIVLTCQISRPIRVLTDTAMEIKRGNLAAQAHVKSGDEVGTLATVFNSMTAQLRQTLKDLEQRVAERTAELTTTNEQLQREVVERKRAEEELRRAEAETRRRLKEQIALREASAVITSTLDLAGVLSCIAQQMGQAVDATSAYICSCEPETMTYTVLAEYVGPQACAQEQVSDLGTTYPEEDLELMETMQAGQHDIAHIDDPDLLESDRAHMQQYGAKTILYIPLWTRGQLLGYVEMWESRRRREFTSEEIALCQGIAQQAAIALENARLYEQAQQDIAERKRAEGQLQRYAADLRQSNEEVKRFTYVASHNLRAPLVNLKGFAAELHAALAVIGSAMNMALPHLDERQQQAVTIALQEDVPEALGFIDSSVTRIDGLTKALLKLSRLGRHELKREPVDMNALVQETLQTLAHQIEQRQVKVTVGSLPTVVADRTLMEQIMGNLLDNAVLYLDPDRPGEIEVTSERHRDETTFRVRDNGCGIAEKDMDKVFAPFRRAGKQDVPGEGMGLAYVQVLVRRHGGRIWCESEPGVGTTFTFTLSNHLVRGERGDAVME